MEGDKRWIIVNVGFSVFGASQNIYCCDFLSILKICSYFFILLTVDDIIFNFVVIAKKLNVKCSEYA